MTNRLYYLEEAFGADRTLARELVQGTYLFMDSR